MSIANRCGRWAALLLGVTAVGAVQAQSQGGGVIHRDIAVQIVQGRGHDPQVNYANLTNFGPWDDRNYDLTADDLAKLSPHEDQVKNQPIPAFYRVIMRKANPNLPKTGPAQYPRSALNGFLAKYGGYQINGATYRELRTVGHNRYEVTVSAPASTQTANFLGGEKRITTPAGAAESAVAVNPVNTNLVIAGTNGPGSGQKMWRSADGGATWSGPVSLAGTCCDPAVGWSPDGSVAYMMALSSVVGSGTNVFFYRSTDNGASWNQTATLSNQHQSDKEYFTVDTFATSPRKGNIYAAWHDNNVQQFARSTDGGVTFGAVMALDSANRGIGSDLTTDKNGNVYFFYPTTTGGSVAHQVRVVKSTDGGATFQAGVNAAPLNADFDFPIPAMETRRAFVYVSAGTDFSNGPNANSIYVAFTDTNAAEDPNDVAANNHSVIKVARSRDGGATWAVSTPHSTSDVGTVDRFNQWLSVDNQGRVFVMYYDTRNSSGRTGTDIYYSVSTDGAVTWAAPVRLTTVTSKNISDSFEWGDYNGMDMQLANIMAIYTDNRDETGGTAESIDVYGIGGFAPSTGNQAPVANFSSSTSGLTANFTDSSTDSDGTIASRAWNFGDGQTSTATSPSHTYAAGGTYSVQLTVTDNGGATNSVTKSVTVSSGNIAPVANFTFTTSQLTASFTNTSTDADGTIASSAWNFGDGATSTTASPSHAYAAAGTYNVSLTVTDNGGATNTKTSSVTVSSNQLQNGVGVTIAGAAGAQVNYTVAIPSGASNLTIAISGGTGDADLYVKFGQAATTSVYDCRPYTGTSTESCPFATPSVGTYYVMVNGYTAYSGVTLKATWSTTTNTAPTANFTSSVSALTVNFTDTSTDPQGNATIASRSWNFGDGSTSTATNPTKTYAAAGTYNVTLTVTDNGGLSNSVTKPVTALAGNTAPVANYTFTTSGLTATFTNTSTDSDGTIASSAWNFGDGTTSTTASPSHAYAAAGTYSVALTVTDNGGATNTKTQSVTVSTGNVLQNGVGVTIAGATGSQVSYTVAIPSGASNLTIAISGGTGDADLYVKFGQAATTSVYDCRPYVGGNAESCPFATPSVGTYYVMVNGYAAYSGVTLKATWTTGSSGPVFNNNTAMAINDNTTINSTIAVSGVTGAASATLKVPVNITHTYQGDLVVTLLAPNGTAFTLWNRTGAGTDNIVQTFTVNASAITAPNGTWTLRVQDAASGDTGTLNSWGLQF